MRHLAAYLLLVAGGNASPTSDDVKTLLATVGVEVDDDRLTTLITELEGKDVNELIALGKTKLNVGGGAPAGGGGGGAAAAAGAPAAGTNSTSKYLIPTQAHLFIVNIFYSTCCRESSRKTQGGGS